MKIYSLVIAAVCVASSAKAQLYNNGATITVSPGAVIFSTGNVTNASGTITNNGKIEVQGNFINSATYNTTTSDDSLIFSGTAASTLNGGASTINNLVINKTGAGGVTLTGNSATVNTKFELLSGTFSTDPAQTFELIAPFAATFTYAAGTEVIGKVRRNGWANGSAKVFNSTNMIVATAGGTAPTSMMVNMVPNGDPGGTEREVKRTFNFAPTAGTGYTANVTFPYKTAELNVAPNVNTEANLVPWYFTASEWNAKLTGNTINVGSDFVSTTSIPAATFASQWKLADPKYTFNVTALLRGPWNGTTMNTAFNSAGLLPLSHPYNTTPFDYTGPEAVPSIPNANIVDWVLLELRKPASGNAPDAGSGTIIGRKAAFLLNNGSIVDLDGVTPASFNINKQGASFVVVRHRNHLAVMSKSVPSNAAGTFANNFSLLANSYKAVGSPSEPLVLLPGGTNYGLWAGDVNKSGGVSVSDVNAIKLAIANSSIGYLPADVNQSNSIAISDVNLTKATISASGTGSAVARQAQSIGKEVKSNVPQ